MILDHLRYAPRVSLLAFGALEGREREVTERHARSCARCRSELEELLALREELLADPVRVAEPGLPLPVLVARVEARVGEALAKPRGHWSRRLAVGLPAAAAIVAVVLLAPRVASRFTPAPPPPAVVDEPPVDFCALARSMGVEATLVEKAPDVGDAVRQALSSGAPHLLELPIASR